MLADILFSIFLADWPNLNVDILFSNWEYTGVMARMTNVRELPPKDVFRILVSGEFL